MRNDSSITSKRNVTLKKTSRTVEFGNDPGGRDYDDKLTEVITTSQNNSPSFYTKEASLLHTDQNKVKRSISESQVYAAGGATEKSDDDLDEVSNNQKLNKRTFHQSVMNEFIDENESWNTSSETDTTDTFMSIESLRCTDEKGGSRKRKAIDNCEDERIRIKKEKNKHGNEEIPNKWHIISEVLNRQIGRNSLFKERFYGSSHAVKRLYLMDSLFDEDQDSAYAVNFNREGNLLASASHKLVFIWDWSVKNLLCVFDHYTCDVIQVKWLPSDEEKIVTCVQNGYICQIYLWDAEYNMSEPLAQHDGYACKLSVHPETPNEFLSTGSDGKIFSIDIRENGPNE
ncbi:DDB1- and CUL4-associated factor 8-like [Mycetomoellerius zeteki]|uniref:DDB1- and CUL4-associated factor 8-like n=1 Tax=Mycetomoellerius zeteki TaxID=64791 RepID=UPI00084ECC72|nr:PREDICTED: DDB1- and CUL4-associated factor 8-like [Trachymyrmex zeteki]